MKMYINADKTMNHVSIDRFCKPDGYLGDIDDVVKAIHGGGESCSCLIDLASAADYLCDGEAMAHDGINDDHEQAVGYLHQCIMDYLCEAELAELECTECPEYD